jgi:hypothetical protein
MITKTSTPEFNTREEDHADISIVSYELKPEMQGRFVKFIQLPMKVFGVLSTVAWTAAALAPVTFNVPINFRPWVFVTFIFWFFSFCAGLFNL